MKKKVLLVDSSEDFLDALEYFLNQDPLVETVTRALPGDDAIAAIKRDRPDVVMVDFVLPSEVGMKLIQDIKATCIPLKVIVLTLNDYDQYRDLAFYSGADEFVSKNKIGNVIFPAPCDMFLMKEEKKVLQGAWVEQNLQSA